MRPESADLSSILGLCYTNLREFDLAIPHLSHALEVDEDCFLASDQLTRCYLGKGELEQAKRAGEHSLSIKDRLYRSTSLDTSLDIPPPPFKQSQSHGNVIAFSLWGDNPVPRLVTTEIPQTFKPI